MGLWRMRRKGDEDKLKKGHILRKDMETSEHTWTCKILCFGRSVNRIKIHEN